MKEKPCRKCGRVLQLDRFPLHPMMADGHLHRCKDCDHEYKQEYYKRTRQERIAKSKAFYEAHREEIGRRSRERYALEGKTREQKARDKAWRLANRERIGRAQKVAYERRKLEWPVERMREMQRRVRAKAKGDVKLELTLVEWQKILTRYDGHCAYCGSDKQICMDHQIPVQRGGKHDKHNVVPACRKCNASKGTSTPAEWALWKAGKLKRTRKW